MADPSSVSVVAMAGRALLLLLGAVILDVLPCVFKAAADEVEVRLRPLKRRDSKVWKDDELGEGKGDIRIHCGELYRSIDGGRG